MLASKTLASGWYFLVLLMCFFLTLNTAASYIMMFLILLLWLIEFRYKSRLSPLTANHLALGFLALFLVHLIGLMWNESLDHGLRILSKQKIYIFAIILLSILNKQTAKHALWVLIGTVIASEFYSLYLYFFDTTWKNGSELSPFMNHMHYSLILSFTVGYLACKLDTSEFLTRNNILLCSLIVLSVVTLFVNIGRIGQLCLPFVILVVTIRKFQLSTRKALLVVTLFATALFAVSYHFSDIFKGRVDKTVLEFSEYVGKDKRSAISCRFEMWHHSYNMASSNPFLGIGTGDSLQELNTLLGEPGVAKLYDECNLGIKYQLNPHNNYVLFYLQFGVFGLALLIGILLVQFQLAIRRDSTPMLILLTVTAIGMLTTSPISMHVKYMFFYSIVLTLLYVDSEPPPESTQSISKRV